MEKTRCQRCDRFCVACHATARLVVYQVDHHSTTQLSGFPVPNRADHNELGCSGSCVALSQMSDLPRFLQDDQIEKILRCCDRRTKLAKETTLFCCSWHVWDFEAVR